MQYLDRDICEKLNLFTYSAKKRHGDWTIDDLSDEDGWKICRQTLINSSAGNNIPIIFVDEVKKDTLILGHEHDGRDLELDYADNCVRNIAEIWGGPVKLHTQVEDEHFEIS
jgi:stage V sporulation protein R